MLQKVTANQARATLRHDLFVLLFQLLDHGVLLIEGRSPTHGSITLHRALADLATIGLGASGVSPLLLLSIRTACFELTCGCRLPIYILHRLRRRLFLGHKLVRLRGLLGLSLPEVLSALVQSRLAVTHHHIKRNLDARLTVLRHL